MSLDRRAFLGGSAASLLLLPLVGCRKSQEERTSVEHIELDRADLRRIHDLIRRKLELDPPSANNELSRLFFSLDPKSQDLRLDAQGPLMRIYIEFYINNVDDLLEKYRVSRVDNRLLLEKREAFLNTAEFKTAVLRYCAKHHQRNPSLSTLVTQLYVLSPRAEVIGPRTTPQEQSRIFRVRAAWIASLADAPQEQLSPLVRQFSIKGRFEVGKNTGFILDAPRVEFAQTPQAR